MSNRDTAAFFNSIGNLFHDLGEKFHSLASEEMNEAMDRPGESVVRETAQAQIPFEIESQPEPTAEPKAEKAMTFEELSLAVKQMIQQTGGKQGPLMKPDANGSFPLKKLLDRYAPEGNGAKGIPEHQYSAFLDDLVKLVESL